MQDIRTSAIRTKTECYHLSLTEENLIEPAEFRNREERERESKQNKWKIDRGDNMDGP